MNNHEFNIKLASALGSKSACDYELQVVADYAINQSIEHRNATPAAHIAKEMQRVKYGNLDAMLKYLVLYGQLDAKNGKVVFKEDASKVVVQTGMAVKWMLTAKKEAIHVVMNDEWLKAQVAALVKRAQSYAKKADAGAGASDKAINSLNDFAQAK